MSTETNIITNEEKLSEWCIEINPKKDGKLTQEIVLKLKDTMKKHNLISLSAPQIGYEKRIFCLKFGKNDYRTFINPVIDNNVGIMMSKETCSSIPDKKYIIPRFGKIHIFYTTPLDEIKSANLAGKAAIQFQHAMDHLNGSLISDIGLEIDDDFENATEEEQAEILKLYAESLDMRQKQLEEDIASNEEIQEILEGARFINSVKSGETILEKSLDETHTQE